MEASTAPASSTSVNPKINSGGVALATGAPAVNQLSPSAIATVYGQQFAPDGTSILQPELDENGRVRNKVANTCVEVKGEWAPLFAILPGQINFQILANVGLGTASVRVVRELDAVPAHHRRISLGAGAGEQAVSEPRGRAESLDDNSPRMRYAEFRRQHLFVGSGVIEAGCKTMIGFRTVFSRRTL